MNATMWSVINQTDWVSKGILLLLLGMSIVCWAISIYKYLLINAKLRQLKSAKALLNNVNSLEDLLARAVSISDSYAGQIINMCLVDFKNFLKLNDDKKDNLNDTDWALFQSNIYQIIETQIASEEALVPVISTCAQSATLIGLFGTVWGLIHAFMGIAQQKTADIAAVAPGIAEALITTLAGLIVAIPALIMFNYVISKIRQVEQALITLIDRCVLSMRTIVHQQSNRSIKVSPFMNPEATKRETI